jgi:hypothetical protein
MIEPAQMLAGYAAVSVRSGARVILHPAAKG